MDKDKLKEIRVALIEQRIYNPHDVFHHEPEFYDIDDERYECEVRCVKWNTRSTRMSVYYPRYDEKKSRWVFARKRGQKRTPHGEQMRRHLKFSNERREYIVDLVKNHLNDDCELREYDNLGKLNK